MAEKKLRQPKFVELDKIKPGEHGYNVYVKVIEVSHSNVIKQDGTELKIAEAKLGDQTAVIKARIVGEYADLIQKDKIIAIRNGRSQVFQEYQRLEVDRWGRITPEDNHAFEKIDLTNDMSNIQYELKVVKKK